VFLVKYELGFFVRFVVLKNVVFWDVTPCGSCKKKSAFFKSNSCMCNELGARPPQISCSGPDCPAAAARHARAPAAGLCLRRPLVKRGPRDLQSLMRAAQLPPGSRRRGLGGRGGGRSSPLARYFFPRMQISKEKIFAHRTSGRISKTRNPSRNVLISREQTMSREGT
jgi:hypothetical protein